MQNEKTRFQNVNPMIKQAVGKQIADFRNQNVERDPCIPDCTQNTEFRIPSRSQGGGGSVERRMQK